VWVSLIPFGLGAWAPAYAGTVMRKRRWTALGALWSIITLAGWVLAVANNGGAAGGLLIILGWAGAIATSFAIRSSYLHLVASPFEEALVGAEQRLTEREQARKLARERPALAKELGVGRPDVANAQDAGLVDINNAPASVLAKLPGVDDALATRIVEARAATHGFTSVEDLGTALDLDGHTVEDLRDCVVFLPRSPS
jgi:DNA uptake protein ComE-like DNA-binding protein